MPELSNEEPYLFQLTFFDLKFGSIPISSVKFFFKYGGVESDIKADNY